MSTASHKSRNRFTSLALAIGIAAIGSAVLTACDASKFRNKVTKPLMEGEDGEQVTQEFPGAPIYRISTVAVENSERGTGKITNVFFNISTSAPKPVSDYCNIGGDRPCLCQYAWSESNSTNGSAVTIPRKVQTRAESVQTSMVSCPAPDAWDREIIDGTSISISVVPAPGNPAPFNVPPKKHIKGPIAKDFAFLDAQGRAFDNVLRYSCYDQTQRGLTVRSSVQKIQNPSQNTSSVNVPLASHFCVADRTGKWIGTNCPEGAAPTDFSAQSYYYNLYIRESENGDINAGNKRYSCPRIHEADRLHASRPFWPLDTTFALSVSPSPDFSVGVEAYSKTSNAGDPKSVSTGCFASGGTEGGSSLGASGDDLSLVRSCLGFAARTKPDGSCPSMKGALGEPIATYRLRRYVAIYPPEYDTNGFPLNQPQGKDTVYVIDRPVAVAGRSADLPPYTMLGPKPCPFSYFDKKMVTETKAYDNNSQIVPAYVATNHTSWASRNVDGLEFPNVDSETSCSAVLLVPNANKTAYSLATVNSNNPRFKRMFIRPVQEWSPHYEEDIDFKACAPLARPLKDPPLHFAKIGENVSWCAEAYPTQNSRMEKLTVTARPEVHGKVKPFTSHAHKNSKGANCSARSLASVSSARFPGGYPSSGAAFHPASIPIGDGKNASETCDRTVVADEAAYATFPLLAEASQTEAALGSDASFGCLVSWDDGAKRGRFSPRGGCCGAATSVVTGPGGAANAHLEPTNPCEIPEY